MFMFRGRRANLTKKLLRKRKLNLCSNAAVDRAPSMGHRDTTESDLQLLLRQLQENQLDMLLTAVDSSGLKLGHCVLVPREHSHEPHLLCCQFWRWPDVRQASELRRLPQCGAADDLVYSCCNPFHWSRLCQPEMPPPPYSRTNEDRIRPEDRAPSELPLLTRNSFESLTTSGESTMSSRQAWCKVGYWEHLERVGPLFPVESCHVDFGTVLYGLDGVSLETLGAQSLKQSEASRKTRAKIGLGITLSREPDGFVWLYNRSDQPVFVDSVYLERCYDGTPVRVPSDHCVCVYPPGGPQMFGWDGLCAGRYRQPGPVGDPNAIRISFVKGWGAGYTRPEITSCPSWLEVVMAPCR